ncbi:MAG: hypothetical protein IJJ11_03165 [Methanosphaera sp.]|nr:hypothetical protein [Methanosphaera sp.]
MNIKRIFLVTALVLLLFATTAVSASDVSDDAALTDDSSVSVSAADSLVNDNNIVTDTVTRENNNKQEKTNIKKATLDTPKTVVVTSTNYSDVFTNTGLCSDVNDGDVIDVQSDITTNNFNITIDKAINLTTTTGAIINLNTTGGNLFGTNPGNSFKIVNSGSYTNVTNLKFYNTQVFVINAHHVTMDNINVTVNNQVVGSGVGVTSIRDNSTYVTVKNSNFYTKNNGGSSSVVLAWADYCTIDNNNITGEGNVGNLLYLTTYNINGTPEYAVDINMYNNITNNNITAVSVTGPCVGVVVTGHDNKFENNKVNVSSSFAGQWMSPTMNEQGDHDDRWEGNSYINNKVYGSFTGTKNSTITDNKFNKTVTLPERCIFKNNNAENSTVRVTGSDCDLCGNTINTLVISAYPIHVCYDNTFINTPTDGNIDWYIHGSRNTNLMNKNYLRSVKTSSPTDGIEYNEVDIDDEETFLKYFSYNENSDVWIINKTLITGNTRIHLGYFPNYGSILQLNLNQLAGPNMMVHYAVVGKNGLTLKNIVFLISGIHFSVSDLNLVYDFNSENTRSAITCQDAGMDGSYVELNNLNITYKTEYGGSTNIIMTTGSSQKAHITIQNTRIDAQVPAITNTFNIIENNVLNTKILDNTINVEENDDASDNPSIVAISGLIRSSNVTWTGNNITMNGKSTLTAIKLDGNTNTITNNNITVTTTGTATGVELNGNDNTVTDNYIVANDKKGDNAVTATGENNVVQDNTPVGPIVIDITEENFSEWFRVTGTVVDLPYANIKQIAKNNTVMNMFYLPENLEQFKINAVGNSLNLSLDFKGLTMHNVYVDIRGINALNLKLVFDEEYHVDGYDCILGKENDNITISVDEEYYEGRSGLTSLTQQHTLKNSNINAIVPSTSQAYKLISMTKANLINNNITIQEKYSYGENPSLIAIGPKDESGMENVIIENNNITMIGATDEPGQLYAIKSNPATNVQITNNNITVTTTGTATGVELNGNTNTVTDNYIVANDKKGDNAVTATGENNVVENNRAPEGGNLIPTSIELTYDTTPIDVGQRLIIRGVFKADGVESFAQGIKVYDNNELIATINTSDEYGTITYGFTPAVGGSHDVKFAFEGNDTHNATSTVIIVETTTPLLSPVVNITADNFYDYFSSEGELDYQMLTDDTTFYFYSIPGDVSQISYTRLSNDVKDKNVTFAGTEDFVLTDTAIIIKSATNNFRLVNMTIVYTDEYQQQDYILFAKTGADEAYIDNCNITANITRQTPKGYPYSVISTANAPVVISNSIIKVDTVETEVDWEPNSDNYGNNNVIPIYTKFRSTLVNNTIEIHAVSDGSMYPTLYGIRLAGHASVMTENNITISGEGWLYAIQPMANNIEVTNNNINITGVNYTAGIMMENISNNTIDNNTIILNARTSREGMGNEPCTYGITIIDYMCGGTAYRETGNAVNNSITNNNITCTAYNMYGIEEFGGSNTTIENNTIVATGDTAMAVGVTGVNILINNNNLTTNGASFSGTTVDYLGARTTGVYLGRGTNATVTNNNISSTFTGVYALAQNIATIEDNNITTTYNYTVLLDSTTQYATVEDNYLETPGRLGDESVSDSGKDNTVENNLPVPEKEYSLIVDTTEFVPGSTATISASIYYGTEYTSDVAQNISKGKVSFKVNGKTLKDANGKVIYAKVVDGTATIDDYQIPDNWNSQTTIQAVYSGSSEVAKMSSEKTAITIVAREPTITTEDVTATAGSTITLTATINTDAVVNTGKVVFKINGKSVKDANGKVIYAKVSNNQVSVEYTLPDDMKTGTYNITAVFISSEYDRLEDTKTLTVN